MTNSVIKQAEKDYNPSLVRINEEKILSLSFNEEDKSILLHNEFDGLEDKDIKNCVRFLIALNSINYQFWSLDDNQFVRYQNKGQTGALGYFAGFLELYHYLEMYNFNIDLIDASSVSFYLGNISDIDNRIELLKESLNTQNFELVFSIIGKHIKTESFNVSLAEKIANTLPLSYKEPYLKKIQLALYEISQSYQIRGKNIPCDITVAADYQIPKVLEGMGILEYDATVTQNIASFKIIEKDSATEKAIRAATILACEKISQIHQISIEALDRLLWLARNDFNNKNFHLTLTTYY